MDSITVIKIGGKVLNEQRLLDEFLDQFIELGGAKVLVHGGGVLATQLAERMGIEVHMKEGRRITNSEMRDIVVMMYGGLVNKTVVASLLSKGCSAIGLTGADANLIRSAKRPPVDGLDYGWVGDPESVNSEFLYGLLQQGMVPVIAPLTHEGRGNLLNTNADTIASFIASSLVHYLKVKLYYAFELPGVLGDIRNKESLIKKLNHAQYEEAKTQGIISKGMIPKLDNAFSAKKSGVSEVALIQYDQILSSQKSSFDAYTRLY